MAMRRDPKRSIAAPTKGESSTAPTLRKGTPAEMPDRDHPARNYFDALGSVPSFRRNQFGGSVGFPLVRDRHFSSPTTKDFASNSALPIHRPYRMQWHIAATFPARRARRRA